MRRSILPLLLLLVLPVPAGRAAAREEVLDDGWFAVSLGGRKSGWSHVRTVRAGEGDAARYRSETDLSLTISRAGQEVTITLREAVTEDAAGRVLGFHRAQKMGFLEMATEGERAADGRLAVTEGGKRRTVEAPDGALGPAAAARKTLAAGLRKGVEVVQTIFSADFLDRPVESRSTVEEREEIDVLGHRRTLWRTRTVISALPRFPTTAWVDDEGVAQVIEMPFPGLGSLRMVRTAEAIAKRAGEPAELFISTLVAPDRALPAPRELRRAIYRLTGSRNRLPDLPTGVGQTISRGEDGSLRVEVDARLPARGSYERPYAGKEHAALLRPTVWLECDDPAVVAFAREAVGDDRDPVAAAHAIERFVRKKVERKSLGVAFATAAEVAKHLEGDCSEHAVLCAAMARAAGMPARVVMGLVYLPPGGGLGSERGVFGYHMWAEVLVGAGEGGDVWLPIDAAIGGMDATHLAVERSDLGSGNPVVDLALPLLDLLGNLRIEVVEPR